MRLDKYLAEATNMSRSDCSRAIRSGNVSVNGCVVKKPDVHVDEALVEVCYRNEIVSWTPYGYLMLSKPSGTTSTTEDDPRSVMKLIPRELLRHDMFPCGRLDVDTEGLLLITDDGPLAHELLSPRHHVEKEYEFSLSSDLSEKDIEILSKGIPMDGKMTKPLRIQMDDARHGHIFLTEGKYHEVKRLMIYVGNEIVYLKRVTFGPLVLDASLAPGECRKLTNEEICALKQATKR